MYTKLQASNSPTNKAVSFFALILAVMISAFAFVEPSIASERNSCKVIKINLKVNGKSGRAGAITLSRAFSQASYSAADIRVKRREARTLELKLKDSQYPRTFRKVRTVVRRYTWLKELKSNVEECNTTQLDLPINSSPTCASVDEAISNELAAARSCTSDAECGQVIAGFGCGCTMSMVARLDASLTQLYELMNSFPEGCTSGYGSMVGVCWCPQANGFACVEGVCNWRYN